MIKQLIETLGEGVVPESSLAEKAILQDKYTRLLGQFTKLEKKNQELEDKLLNVVEKTERDKIILSEEIDELSKRLTYASNHSTKLENECARYKSDCVLAVHLLQCQPSSYVAQKLSALPNDVRETAVQSTPFKNGSSVSNRTSFTEQSTKKMISVSSHATFPPTAIFYNPEEYYDNAKNPVQEEQPEDPVPKMQNATIDDARESLQQVFVEKIRSQPDYNCVELKQCKKCGSSLAMIDKWTQTITTHLLGHSASASVLSRLSESGSRELLRLDSGSELNEELTDKFASRTEINALKCAQPRIRSTDSEMSTDTQI